MDYIIKAKYLPSKVPLSECMLKIISEGPDDFRDLAMEGFVHVLFLFGEGKDYFAKNEIFLFTSFY